MLLLERLEASQGGQETATEVRGGAFESLQPRAPLRSRRQSPLLGLGTHQGNTPASWWVDGRLCKGNAQWNFRVTLHSHHARLDQSIPAPLELRLSWTQKGVEMGHERHELEGPQGTYRRSHSGILRAEGGLL